MVQKEGLGDGEEEDERGAGGSGAGRARVNKKKADAANKLIRMVKGIELAAGGTAGGSYVRARPSSFNIPSFVRLSCLFFIHLV
jgi:hypothetical protein